MEQARLFRNSTREADTDETESRQEERHDEPPHMALMLVGISRRVKIPWDFEVVGVSNHGALPLKKVEAEAELRATTLFPLSPRPQPEP
jgi:hypothetical protein